MADEEEQNDGEEEQLEEGAEAAAVAATAPAGPSKLVVIILVVNVLVMLGLVAVVMSSKSSKRSLEEIAESEVQGGEHGEAPKNDGHGGGPAKDEAPVDLFVVESFTVNLAESSGSHYAQVDVSIEASDLFTKGEITRIKPKIRDFIIYILSSKSYAQLDSADSRDFLREEIRNKINGYLSKGEVQNVFFTKFIVQ